MVSLWFQCVSERGVPAVVARKSALSGPLPCAARGFQSYRHGAGRLQRRLSGVSRVLIGRVLGDPVRAGLVLMPPAKHKASAKRNGAKAAEVHKVTEEQRQQLESSPPLTLITKSTARAFADVVRADSVRDNRRLAKAGWRYVLAHFNELPLSAREGAYSSATKDYGGLRARMELEPARGQERHGLVFKGTRSYDKKGVSRGALGKTTKPLVPFIHALFDSLSECTEMQLINARFGAFKGVVSLMHTDANSRGTHPNAMRCLDAGGGLQIFYGVSFRCSPNRGVVSKPTLLRHLYLATPFQSSTSRCFRSRRTQRWPVSCGLCTVSSLELLTPRIVKRS